MLVNMNTLGVDGGGGGETKCFFATPPQMS